MMQALIDIETIEEIQTLIDVIPNPVIVKNRRHRIVMLNLSACEFFGYSREVVLGSSDFDLFPADQVRVFQRADDLVFASGLVDEREEQVTNAAGEVRTVITRKQRVPLRSEDYIVGVITDVTAYREAEAHNRYLALHDALTGLPNRTLLNDRLDQLLLRARRTSARYALIYVDLDQFKGVNDSYGHQAGDELVRQFASRLVALLRSSDTAARIGRDEFAILIEEGGMHFSPEDVCRRILAAAALPFDLAEGQAFVSASVGVAEAQGSGPDNKELHQRADMALYQAKREGRGCFRIFSQELADDINSRRQLEVELRECIADRSTIRVEYQPLFAAVDGIVVAFEALVRWDHPRLGPLLPASFLDVAEESGLIHALGDIVIERSCRTLANWPEVALAVNISGGQLASEDFVERTLTILEAEKFDPRRLQLEVTEHAILDVEKAEQRLEEIRAAGVQIVLDDFGTGYSSLSHLQKLRIDKVKIDRSFVQDIGSLRESRAIVKAVARLGRSLGVAVTAEGVETEDQRSFLRALGCAELQGYLLSHPLDEWELETIRARSPLIP
jgi:diguanylate cyclase (GGDEF)-like protein/PAS domain S-box-containing protein